jgi:hypothetical protein
LLAGANNITAVYAGDANFTGISSAAITESVLDFNFTLGSTTPASQTVQPGQAANFAFTLSPQSGSFNLPITLSATGLPPGATVTFTPQTLTLGVSPSSFTMTIQTAVTGASVHSNFPGIGYGGGTISLGLLLLPFSRSLRRKARSMGSLTLCAALLLSFAAIAGLVGCGTGSGFFAQPVQTCTINVTGTATSAGQATLQHSSSVTLTVQ